MALPIWTILIATVGIIWFLKRRQAKKEKLGNLKELPGPQGFPIVGNALQMGQYPNDQFCKWTKEYGDLYKVQLGNQTMVVVSDPKLTKDIFSSEPAFTGRLILELFEMYPDTSGLGIIGSEGDRWEVHRRFLLRQLRDFGFGKSSMEALILDELSEVIERYKKQAGTPVGKIRQTLRLAVVNSLWTIITSKRFDQDDPTLLKLANYTSETFNEVLANGGLLIFMPWLMNIIPEYSGYNAIRKVFDDNRIFMEKTIKEKKANFKDGDLNDFIDVFLAEMKKAENDPKSQFHGEIGERQLAVTLFDLFFAGSDTTATTTAWSILYLCKFPYAQKKLQEEIAEVTGNTRKVSVDDRTKMPYTLALIDEILRFSSIVPDGVQHRAMADREFHGYHIPKNALIQPNMYYIHHNPAIWGDPEKFRPERFLSADGKKYVKSDNLQAFQIGRRQCVGETLARDTIFMYLTNLFQQFHMEFDPKMEKEPTLEAEVGFLRAPKPYTVIMTDRLAK